GDRAVEVVQSSARVPRRVAAEDAVADGEDSAVVDDAAAVVRGGVTGDRCSRDGRGAVEVLDGASSVQEAARRVVPREGAVLDREVGGVVEDRGSPFAG